MSQMSLCVYEELKKLLMKAILGFLSICYSQCRVVEEGSFVHMKNATFNSYAIIRPGRTYGNSRQILHYPIPIRGDRITPGLSKQGGPLADKLTLSQPGAHIELEASLNHGKR